MNRIRALFSFIVSGGLLILLAPYLVYEATTKQLPWSVAVIAIPIYALLSYGAFKLYGQRIFRRAGKSADGSRTSDERR